MKRTTVLSAALAFSLAAAPAFCAGMPKEKRLAPPPPPAMGGMDPAQQAMMAKWKAFSTPSEGHRVLDALVGAWDHTVQYWMAAGAPPEQSSGSGETRWILGGRYLRQDVTGTSMGQPFEGMGLTGFDNLTGQYEGIWIDNMGTGMMKGTGKYDPAARTITDLGTMPDGGEGKVKPYRGVLTFVDADHYTYEMYTNTPDGREFKAMKIVYTRKK